MKIMPKTISKRSKVKKRRKLIREGQTTKLRNQASKMAANISFAIVKSSVPTLSVKRHSTCATYATMKSTTKVRKILRRTTSWIGTK